MDEPFLQLNDVTKKFGAFTAVDSVSFSVGGGTILGFLGPNGAGKTTIIRMVLDIFRPTTGHLSVLGKPSALMVRDRIGYLPEEKGLYKKMKAWGIIAYFATLKGMPRKAAKIRAYELLERYGLKDFADAKTESLSKGMGQKVQVLASIAHDPDLVILDEPFSGLDPVNQQVMEEIIIDMAGRRKTVIFSTHVMQHAERLCNQIILINRGKKIFEGSVGEAKDLLPRTIRIDCNDSLESLENLGAVDQLRRTEEEVGEDGKWLVQIKDGANPQEILRFCVEQGLNIRSFESSDPSLHDVFVELVGDGAKETLFR
ncbi:ATP-binding cassette domain-containing protein [Verrucomicrobia bacterium]|nr:ATP-binding cassette domain-containing protein [Verrucomicrobiota bacterium]